MKDFKFVYFRKFSSTGWSCITIDLPIEDIVTLPLSDPEDLIEFCKKHSIAYTKSTVGAGRAQITSIHKFLTRIYLDLGILSTNFKGADYIFVKGIDRAPRRAPDISDVFKASFVKYDKGFFLRSHTSAIADVETIKKLHDFKLDDKPVARASPRIGPILAEGEVFLVEDYSHPTDGYFPSGFYQHGKLVHRLDF